MHLPALVVAALLAAQQPPQVVSLEPANGSLEVDAQATKRLVVVFDRPMADPGWSFCGGGPTFPKVAGKPRYETPTRLVVDVELEPDRDYSFQLNCAGKSSFRGADGAPLAPLAWSFATSPDPRPDPAAQEASNRAALDALRATLESSYSYFGRRLSSWDELVRGRDAAVLAARSPRAWAAAAGRLLEPTGDVHLYLRYGDRVYAAGRLSVDPLWRAELAARYAAVERVGKGSAVGRTQDGIGYLMVASWTDAAEVDAVEAALPALRDARAIVVDARPNSGGDELLARRVAAWFVEGTRVYAKHRSRTGPGEGGFGPVEERALAGHADPAKRIDAPLFVLTSRYVISSNEAFVLMLRQARDCTVVGERTFGSSGNPKPHELPNGVTVLVPSWECLRPDGTCFEVEGLAPDVPIEVDPRVLASRDPILERALELARAKVAR